jgi:hypothetical protein
VGQGAGKQALITFFFPACQKDQRGQAIVLLSPFSVLPAPCSLLLAPCISFYDIILFLSLKPIRQQPTGLFFVI